MIHRILGYLWCKTERLTRHSDTSMYSWHVPTVLSVVFMLYGVDIALVYWAVTSTNPGVLFLFAFPVIWIILYVYYHYKRRYLKIQENKSYEKYSSIWAVIFLLFPFVFMIIFALVGDRFYMPY